MTTREWTRTGHAWDIHVWRAQRERERMERDISARERGRSFRIRAYHQIMPDIIDESTLEACKPIRRIPVPNGLVSASLERRSSLSYSLPYGAGAESRVRNSLVVRVHIRVARIPFSPVARLHDAIFRRARLPRGQTRLNFQTPPFTLIRCENSLIRARPLPPTSYRPKPVKCRDSDDEGGGEHVDARSRKTRFARK